MLQSIKHIIIDANNPKKLAEFWSKATGLKILHDYGEFIILESNHDFPHIAVYKVPEKKQSKNRVHLDFRVEDEVAESKRLVKIGGTEISKHGDDNFHWRVMTDPEGNEFCISGKW